MMKKILLIEDDEISRELVLTALQGVGLTDVTCAVDGAHGLALFDQMDPKPDIVICDIFMPNKDGIETLDSLVAREYAGGVILISGGDLEIISMARMLARKGGLKLLAVLLKPFDDQALAQALLADDRGDGAG